MNSLRRIVALGLLVLVHAPTRAQVPALSAPPVRYVDCSRDLERPEVAVVVGTLGPWKEGKRERLVDGQLGGAGSVASIAGAQFFKLRVQAQLLPRTVLHGRCDKPTLGFDLQLARLPDGKEQRQLLDANGTRLADGTLAMFVVEPLPKGKGHALLHCIPFDGKQQQGADREAEFVDSMADVVTINRRVLALRTALATAEAAKTPQARTDSATALRQLVAEPTKLKVTTSDPLLAQHCGPLLIRAKQWLAEQDRAKADADKR